jgi:hypothetical protein
LIEPEVKVVEPVVIQNNKLLESEQNLQALKTKIGMFFLALVLTGIVIAYFLWWPKKAVYAGKTLPGIGDTAENLTIVPKVLDLKPIKIEQNVVSIAELLPLWPMEDIEEPNNGTRVSETDPSVLQMIRDREKATNELEAFQGLAKQTNFASVMP